MKFGDGAVLRGAPVASDPGGGQKRFAPGTNGATRARWMPELETLTARART